MDGCFAYICMYLIYMYVVPKEGAVNREEKKHEGGPRGPSVLCAGRARGWADIQEEMD